jgi:hypothetical protein
MKTKPIDVAIMARAQLAGAEGFSTADIVGFDVRAVDNAARRLSKAGKLHRGKAGHRTMRIFAQADWAAAYSANYVTASARRPVNPASGPGAWCDPKRAPRITDTEPIYPRDENGNPLWKHTVVPGFTPDRLRDMPIRTNTHSEI